ncbi:MAG: hypothetical protein KJO79_05835, partial [Verrucomicrobiae bacterium]|nr:hypothetical protein [Verrucomicrobiae bacterium]NNJ86684.1 hypothetical protein [Akkermansiaceae bacterium]
RRDQSQQFATDIADLAGFEVKARKADKLRISEREKQERLEAKEQEDKRIAEHERRAAEAIEKQKREEEEAKAEAQRLKQKSSKADQDKVAKTKEDSAQIHTEAVPVPPKAEQETQKTEEQEQQPSPQKQNRPVGTGSKKKPIIVAAAAVLIAALVFAGIKFFTGDDDKRRRTHGPRTDVVSVTGAGDTNTSAPDNQNKPNPTALPKRTECVVIIPLSDGGKRIPDDAEMALYSGPIRYGDLIKEAGVLKTTISEATLPEGEQFEIKFKNKNYAFESNITLKSDDFREVKPDDGNYRYKGSLSLSARANFAFTPSLATGFTQYRKPLFQLLKIMDHMKVLDAKGSRINGASATYDQGSEEINISMPVGWSFNGKNAELKIDWPYFKPLSIKIGPNGLLKNQPWVIQLRKYNLHLSALKDKMPRFNKVAFMPKPPEGIGDDLTRVITALIEQSEETYSMSYQDIRADNDILEVPSQQGDLYISGGSIHEEGMFFTGAVKRGKLIASFTGFPKGIYFAPQPIPYQFKKEDGSYLYGTVPSVVAIHLTDQVGGVSNTHRPFEFRVMIEANLKMATFVTQLKLKSWDQRKNQWTLTTIGGKQQALNLILVIRENQNGTLNVDYTDITINGSSPYSVDAVARSKWGLAVEKKEDGKVHQKLKMQFNHHSDNAQLFSRNFEDNFLSAKQDFDNLKLGYSLPPSYPAFSRALFEKLGNSN